VAAELSAAVSTDAKGRPLGLVMVARDITEHKRAEEDLRNVSRRIIEAQEAERLRVARELHEPLRHLKTHERRNQRSPKTILLSIACQSYHQPEEWSSSG
jgi:hypothetical protein